MSITTTTSKGQITIPKEIRDKLGLKPGVKIDIYPTTNGFIGKPQRKSRIMDFAGSLKHLDDGRPFKEIREQAQKAAAEEIVRRLK